jgi:hypothetical protein
MPDPRAEDTDLDDGDIDAGGRGNVECAGDGCLELQALELAPLITFRLHAADSS